MLGLSRIQNDCWIGSISVTLSGSGLVQTEMRGSGPTLQHLHLFWHFYPKQLAMSAINHEAKTHHHADTLASAASLASNKPNHKQSVI